MKRLHARLVAFWFERSRQHPLGLIRIVLGAWCTLRYAPTSIARAAQDALVAPELYALVPGRWLLPLPYPPQGAALAACEMLLWVSGCAATLGLLTRVSLLTFSAALLYFSSGVAAHGYFNHEQILPLQVLFVLAFAPGARAWSLDRLILLLRRRRRRSLRAWRGALQGPAVELWGLRTILVLLALIYTTAGISKLRFSGGRWFDGRTLGYYLDGTHQIERWRYEQIYLADPGATPAQRWKDGAGLVDHSYGLRGRQPWRWLVESPLRLAALSSAVLLFELAAFLLLCGQPWLNLYLIGAFVMHSAIAQLMAIHFIDYQWLLLCLFDWRAAWRGLRRRSVRRSA